MKELKRVAKNSTFSFMNNLFSKAFSLVIIIILARHLGVEQYGLFSFVLSFTGLFAVFGNFGLSILLNRIVSRNKKKVGHYFTNALILSAFLNILTFAVIMFFAWILRYEPTMIKFILIGAVFVVFQNLKVSFKSVYEAFERMHYVFWTRISKILLRLVLILLFVFLEQGVFVMLLTYAAVEVIMIFVDIFVYTKKIGSISLKPNVNTWLGLFKKAIPFGIAGIFMTVYDKIDVTMISRLVENPNVMIGYYSSAYDIMSSLSFIALSLSGALAPIAYRSFVSNKEKLKKIYKETFKLFLALSIGIAIGGTFVARELIILIYGQDFAGAAVVFQILVWSVIFNFQMFSHGLALNSMNREKDTMKATMYSVVFNVVANLLLIPILGIVGAAITTVLSVLIYVLYCHRIVQKKLVAVNSLTLLLKALIPAIIMAILLVVLKPHIHVLLSIAAGGVVYILLLFAFKYYTRKQLYDVFVLLRIKK